jgi:hypothetical protein
MRDTQRYDPNVNRSVQRAIGLLGFGVVLSQAGHLLAYELQFGAAAQSVQSTGVHSYFPIVVKTSLGVAATALIGALLIMGSARFLTRRATASPTGGPSYLNLLALLFTVQMACFGLQETIESLVAGMPVASAPQLLLLGTLGQLPVAIIAAVALKWLLVRFDAALATLRSAVGTLAVTYETSRVLLLPRAPRLQPALAQACPAAYIKRGPPTQRS